MFKVKYWMQWPLWIPWMKQLISCVYKITNSTIGTLGNQREMFLNCYNLIFYLLGGRVPIWTPTFLELTCFYWDPSFWMNSPSSISPCLCRFIVSGAPWMWTSALPHCLPLHHAPTPFQPTSHHINHLCPLNSHQPRLPWKKQKTLPPLSNVVAQLWMWTLDTENKIQFMCVWVCVLFSVNLYLIYHWKKTNKKNY